MLGDVAVEPVNIGLKEACRITGLGKTTIYELIKTGKLTIRKYGAKTLFDYAEVRDFARSIPVEAQSQMTARSSEHARRRSQQPRQQVQTQW